MVSYQNSFYFHRQIMNHLNPLLWTALLVLLLTLIPSSINAMSATKKFEYKYSFKPPYLAQKDGTVPFFEHSGNAIASEENLRVTPSLRSQKGQIWSKLQTTFAWWEVELVFRISGRGRVGADGLVFWYRAEKGQEGPVFGTTDQWNGLGIFFDSFDNDNKHNNPYIMAITNDGSKMYDHQNDGSTQQLAGCLRDFRNKPFPVRAKIQYFNNILVVLFNNGMSNNEDDYEMCMRVENVFLPSRGYFGVSAATGGLADDHDVQKLMTWSLTPVQDGLTQPVQTPSPDQQKFEQEFQNYQKQLEQQKEQYLKEHPDEKPKDEDDWFEEEQIRELRQIYQGQSEVKGLVQALSRKLDEIVGRQETTISLVTSIQASGFAIGQQGTAQHVPVQPVGGGPAGGGVQIQRHEIDGILAASRELVQSSREIKNILSTISSKQDQAAAKPASYGSIDYTSSFNELREGLNIIKRDVSTVTQRVNTQPIAGAQMQAASCPEVSCVSTTLFIAFTCIQMGVLIAYSIYKSNKDNQAKKFY